MNPLMVLLTVVLYFCIGVRISDFLEEKDDMWRRIVLITWPAVLTIIVVYILFEYICRRDK